MKWLHRIFYFSIFGALGGLAGSFLHQMTLLETLAQPLEFEWRIAYLALLGLLVGAPIGFFPSFSEGWGRYSIIGAIRTGLIGATLGAIGGMIALPIAEVLHNSLGGGVKGRAIALALLGLGVGLAEGINSGVHWWRSAAGGLIGGIVAGYALEFFIYQQETYTDSGIIALILVGLFITLFVSLFVNILADAWLEGLPGSKVDGQIYHLSKFREPHEAFLGSDKKGSIFIWIPGAKPRHASITLTTEGAKLQHLAKGGETRINGNPVKKQLLRDGEVIEIAEAKLRYREKRKAIFSSLDLNKPVK